MPPPPPPTNPPTPFPCATSSLLSKLLSEWPELLMVIFRCVCRIAKVGREFGRGGGGGEGGEEGVDGKWG